MTSNLNISRRRFLQGAGGLTFCVALGADGIRLISEAEAQGAARTMNAWVRIGSDDTVTILSPGAEKIGRAHV